MKLNLDALYPDVLSKVKQLKQDYRLGKLLPLDFEKQLHDTMLFNEAKGLWFCIGYDRDWETIHQDIEHLN